MSQFDKLIVGNWKMFGMRASLAELDALAADARGLSEKIGLAVCPPATLLALASERLADSRVALGGQDCHALALGAYTGDVSAEMLADLGCRHVILGHSERRTLHGETDALVRDKAEGALRAGLIPILCVGESAAERDAGQTLAVIRRQLAGSTPRAAAQSVIIAYEPFWAIGTGRTPTTADVEEVCTDIRLTLGGLVEGDPSRTLILYGGSVKPSNAGELMSVPNVDGALVGSASLKAADFLAIARACV